MILQRAECHAYSVPLKKALVTAKGAVESRDGLIVVGRCRDGQVGLGEVAPLPPFSRETMGEAQQALAGALALLKGLEIPAHADSLKSLLDNVFGCIAGGLPKDSDSSHRERPEGARRSHKQMRLPRRFAPRNDNSPVLQQPTNVPSVVFGIATMLADLASQDAGLPLAKWFDSNASTSVPVNAFLSGDKDTLQRQLLDKQRLGYTAYKLKVGSDSQENEIKQIAIVRETMGGTATIRLDANCAFTYSQALSFLKKAREYDIEYIEDPLRVEESNRLVELRGESGVPVALDEVTTSLKLDRPLPADVLILKPMILGGFHRTISLSRLAADQGIKSVITSTIESGVGVAAVLHIAAVLGDRVLACGLDTLDLLADKLIDQELKVTEGRMMIPDSPGLGVAISQFDNVRFQWVGEW